MSTSLRICAIILIIIYFGVIIQFLKNKRFALKYSLLWLIAGMVMLVLVIWPEILVCIASALGIEVATNGLFGICIFLGIVIMISFTSVISDFANRIKTLTQNIAILERRIRVLEEKVGKDNIDER